MEAADSAPRIAPATRSNFLGGFMSGATNGAMIAGIYSLVSGIIHVAAVGAFSLAAFNPLTILGVAALVATAGTFSGIMSVRRAGEEAAAARATSRELVRDAQLLGTSRDLEQTLDAPEQEILSAEEQTPGATRWRDRAMRNPVSVRTQAILDQGHKAKQSRIESLLAERETAALTQPESQR